jgi:hypothetical protein
LNFRIRPCCSRFCASSLTGWTFPWVNLTLGTYYSDGRVPGTRLEGSFWWRAIFIYWIYNNQCLDVIDTCTTFLHDLWHDRCLNQSFAHLLTYAKDTNAFFIIKRYKSNCACIKQFNIYVWTIFSIRLYPNRLVGKYSSGRYLSACC